MIDFICRDMLNKLTRRMESVENKLKIVFKFVLKSSTKLNSYIDNTDKTLALQSRCISSLGRSMKMCSTLFGLNGSRLDELEDNLEGYREHSAELWEDMRKAETKIINLEASVDKLQKLHTTKIAKFIYSGPPTPDQERKFVRGCGCRDDDRDKS